MNVKQALDLGIQHHRAGNLRQAEMVYRQVLVQQPNQPDALHLLGMVAHQIGRSADAVELMKAAIAADPSVAEYYNNVGIVLESMGKSTEALEYFRRAVELKPENADACNNLSSVLQAHGRYEESEQFSRRAIELSGNAIAHNTLGNALIRQGRVDEAIEAYRKALKIDPNFAHAASNYLLCLHYGPGQSTLSEPTQLVGKPPTIFREHVDLMRHVTSGISRRRQHANTRDPERRIRVAYLSPDFCSHSVSYFIEPVLANHDRERFEVFCYSDTRRRDETTERLKGLATQWRDTTTHGDDVLSELMMQDGIDILVDLAGHTASNRAMVLARKPVPIIATYLGYPDTTGLETVDYRLTDSVADPFGTDPWHTEKLVRLDPCAWCYRSPSEAPEVNALPAQTNGFLTFGSFNALAKVSAQTVKFWVEVLKAIANARLVIKAAALGETRARARLMGRFMAQGIDRARLDLLGPNHEAADHLATYHRIDIALDTFPYNGTATTCEALWMGVPVITQSGETHVSRVGRSLLSAVALEELSFVTPFERLAEIRRTLRERMRASPLMDERGFTKRLENVYREMWVKWCST